MDATLAEAAPFDRPGWLERCEAAYPAVYRGLIAMGATPHDAADALQDAFEDALRVGEPVARADGWLFIAAKRTWRRSRWRRRIFHPLDLVRGSIRSDRDEEIDLLVELSRLTERQRTVVVARYVLGLTQAEIAELLGIAPGTVAATAHQATSLLRGRLNGEAK
jgi:RNA polymerase sigma factor (sigma-70 family)